MKTSLNRIFKVIWSKVQMAWVAVSEAATAHGKQQSITRITRTITTVAMLSGGAAIAAPPAPNQLPTGGQVAAGIAAIGTNGNTMTVTQISDRAAINWNTFDIGSQAAVNFVQPSANAVALNRVNSPNPSQIYGQLSSNGQVYLINAAGVYFAPGAQVNVGGIVATTMQMSDAAFMAGSTTFERNGATGKVINEGSIQTRLNGYIAMLAPEVRNSGLLLAQSGTVAMAAGESITLNFGPTSKLDSITVTEAQLDTLVENRTAIKAPNGLVILSARAANQLAASVINSGTIEAKGASQQGGRILLEGSTVTNTGTLDVSSDTAQAGTIQINGKNVSISGNVIASTPAQNAQGGAIKVSATQSLNVINAAIDAVAANGTGGRIQFSAHQIAIADSTLSVDGDIQGGGIQLTATASQPNNPFHDPLNIPVLPASLAATGFTSISSRGRRGQGGNVTLAGDEIRLQDNTNINVSGATGGGNALIGGDWQGSNGVYQATTVSMAQGATIDASATDNGNGGKVVLWSDIHNANGWTNAYGSIYAKGGQNGGDGGQIETSGARLEMGGQLAVDAGSTAGQGGLWLIDPYNYIINSTAAATISGALNGGTSVTVSTDTSNTSYGGSTNSNDAGTISIDSAIAKTAGGSATLTLQADSAISGAANISNTSDNLLSLVFNVGASSGTYSGSISGSTQVTKAGAGTLVLSGTSTYTGATTVNAGTLKINDTGHLYCAASDCNGAFGNPATAITKVNSGAVLDLANWGYGGSFGTQYFDAFSLVINGGTLRYSGANTVFGGSYGHGFTVDSSGATFESASAGVNWSLYDDTASNAAYKSVFNGNVTFTGAGDFTSSHIITGNNTVTKNGSGTATLLANNTYTGATIINAGTLVLQNDAPTKGTSGFNGPGALRVEPTSASFTNDFSTTGWTFGSTLGGLTLGKAGNTKNMTVAAATSIAGPISVYGGQVQVQQNLTSAGAITLQANTTDVLIDGAITNNAASATSLNIQAFRNIRLGSNASITSSTTPMTTQLWADSTATGDGILYITSSGIDTKGGDLTFGKNGQTASIGGQSVLVGGDVFFQRGSAQTLSTGGGSFTVYGQTLIGNSSGLNINSANGAVTFNGAIDSANQYTSVNVPAGITWTNAVTQAKSGVGTAPGDTYLATVTSRLENSIASQTVGYNESWLGGRRVTGIGTDNLWRWVTGPEAAMDGGKGLVFAQQNTSGTNTANGATSVNGYFNNWSTNEPNNYQGVAISTENESALQFTGNLGKWNDLPKTISPLYYYVKETNALPSPLTINAGSGALSIQGGVGSSKALASLNVTSGSTTVNGNGLVTTGAQTYSSALTANAGSNNLLLQGTTITAGGAVSATGTDISLNANLTNTLSGADILLKGTGSVTQAASTAVTSNNGNVTYWADSDNNGSGNILLSAGTSTNNTSITTNGGAITLGGGTDPLTGYAKGANTGGADSFGVNLAGYGKLNAGTGTISLRGSTAETAGNYGIGVRLINSSSLIGGDISLSGIGSANTGSYANNWGVSMEIASTITASGTLAITGTGGGGNSSGGGNHGIYLTGSTLASSGDMTLTGTGGGKSGGGTGNKGVYVYGGSTVVSGAGAMTLIGTGGYNGSSEGIAIAGSSVTNTLGNDSTQTGAITLRADNPWFDTNSTNKLLTTGTVTIEPVGTSFTSALTYPVSGLTVGSTISGLTLGKSGNTADIIVTSGYGASIAGPISIYGGNIAINAGLTTTNATTGNIGLMGNVSGAGNIALATNRTLTINQSGNSIYTGVISGTGATLVKSGVGVLSLLGANTYTGGTTLNAGTLGVYNNSALGTGALTAADGTNVLFGRAVTTFANDMLLNGVVTLALDTYVDYLIVGGGGGGGNAFDYGGGGGGGAGGMLTGCASFAGGAGLNITVGAGGAGGAADRAVLSGANGGDSSIGTIIVATGGGGGGGSRAAGLSGGSGGGAGGRPGDQSLAGGLGVNGQGYAGGAEVNVAGGAGGGGAGSAGVSPSSGVVGAGGAGLASTITGSSVTYATGGAGGSNTTQQNGVSAAANLGGGGGGASSNAQVGSAGGTGGSGIVVVRYKGGVAGTGGTFSSGTGSATGYTVQTFTSNGTLTLNPLSVTLSGNVSGAGSMVANAANGTFTMTGTNNTYTGATNVTAGTFNVSGGGLSASTAVNVSSGAIYNVLVSNTVGSIAGAGNMILGNGYTLTAGGDNTTTTFSGCISGSGNLVKAGTGTLTLSGTNTYTGTTDITAGTFNVNGSLADTTVVNVSGDGVYGVLISDTVGSFAGNGTINLGSGVALTAFGDNNSATFGGVITGAGSLTKVGSGTLTLSGTSDYAGSTTISAGTLQLGNGGAAGSVNGSSNIAISSGAVLAFHRSDDATVANNITGAGEVKITQASNVTLSGAATYTGNTSVDGGVLTFSNNVGPTSANFTGNGSLVIQPSTSFNADYNFSANVASTISGLTLGSASNTANITLSRGINIAGPIKVLGGNITQNSDLITSASGAGILLKASSNISTISGILRTNNGNLTLWADSDGSGIGSIAVGANTTINTANGNTTQTSGGGQINLAGGTAVDANGLPTGYASSSTGSGVSIGAMVTIYSGGGNVLMAGRSTGGSSAGLQTSNGLMLKSGTGAITLLGNSSVGHGVQLSDGTGFQSLLYSLQTSGTAITVNGSTTAANNHGVYFNSGSVKSVLQADGGGGITITGSSTNASPGTGVMLSVTKVLASSGAITINGGTAGINTNSDATVLGADPGAFMTDSGATKTYSTNSSASTITLTGDKLGALNADVYTLKPLTVNTNGSLVVQPSATSFAGTVNVNLTLNGVSSLTVGKSGNEADLIFSKAISIAGPIAAYGSNITLNSGLTTTNATTGDINLSGNVSGAGNIALATGRTLTINQSDASTYSGCISGTTSL